jgi:hypothetical protein
MEIVAIVLAVLAVALVAVALLQLRGRGGIGAVARGRPSPIRRRDVPRDDALAAAVVSHSAATDPDDVAVEELRLRARANRVAAAAHERDAGGLRSHDAAAADERRLEADAHREAAVEHHRTADELERRAERGDTRLPYADPRSPDGL